ncbi:hypothetical protein [Lewinella cohaerens]|uniref:hypothetical protein n=1 Tax=Lewinella cohaerens TaxID=70995 RepID=UPI00035E2E9C|nr:hypothetical protein [Lewinella cohaerens]
MKIHDLLALLLLLLGVFSCEPPVVFTEAQPDVVPSSTHFQKTYQGIYLCTGDSATVRIGEKTIIKERHIQFESTLDEIKETKGIYIDGEYLYIEELDLPVPIEYLDGEIVTGSFFIADTLFQIGPEQVLKYYKGHQVLNRKLENKHWETSILSKDKEGNLTLWTTQLPEDLEQLKAITPVEDVSTPEHTRYLISPNIAEFRKLLDSKLIFEVCDYFERMDPSI